MKINNVLSIGAGYFASLHLDSWLRQPEVEVVGLVDLDSRRSQNLRASLGGQFPLFSNTAEAIEVLEPDVIDIATPPATHEALITSALRSTARVIICQKPFCGDLATARRMVAAAKGRTLVVHENFRFQPWYRVLAQALPDLGTLYQLTFRFRPGDGQGNDAYLARQPYFQQMPRFLVHETAIHWIDVFRFLLGEPTALYADLRQRNLAISGEDCGQISLDFSGGVQAIFDGNRLADHAAENPRCTMGELLAEGSEGSIELRGDGSLWRRAQGAEHWAQLLAPDATGAFGGDCVHHFQSHVVRHLTEGSPLETLASDYIRNQELEELVYQSAAEGRKLQL